jgi:hypothetical protein
MADGMTIGGDPRFEEKDLVILTVTNRGDAPTTVENMVLFEIGFRPGKTSVVFRPPFFDLGNQGRRQPDADKGVFASNNRFGIVTSFRVIPAGVATSIRLTIRVKPKYGEVNCGKT